jgi:hypothetical protein
MARTIGILLIVGALIGCLLLALVMFVPTLEGSRTAGAAVLGFALFGIILLAPLGGGIFLLWRGGQEAKTAGKAQQQRQLLNMVTTRGQVAISDLAIEMNLSRDEVQQILYDLVGKRLFSAMLIGMKVCYTLGRPANCANGPNVRSAMGS